MRKEENYKQYVKSKRNFTTKEERVNMVVGHNLEVKRINNKLSEYLESDNVRNFNMVLTDRALVKTVKKGRSILDSDELMDEVVEYFQLCLDTQILPTIQSLSTFLGIEKGRLYEYARSNRMNSQMVKNAIELCHTNLLNGALSGSVNSVLYMFLSKNWHGMQDISTVNLSPQILENTDRNETLNAIQEQLVNEQETQN